MAPESSIDRTQYGTIDEEMPKKKPAHGMYLDMIEDDEDLNGRRTGQGPA
jgi:hypothetical protein